MKITNSVFGITDENEQVKKYTLINSNGYSVSILNYGGIITDINVPDRNGNVSNVVLSYDHFEPYKNNPAYFGAIIGRFAGRIANGQFTLNESTYNLCKNSGTNCLHGGEKGFDKAIWSSVKTSIEHDKASLSLNYLSRDMEEGFPGNFDVTVTYTWDNNQRLNIDYKATTDKETIYALTNHAYFNLSNDLTTDILNHSLMINANEYVEIDENSIPIKISPVTDTPFDFREPKVIKSEINMDNEQLNLAGGYDHPFIIDHSKELTSGVYCKESGRYMEVFTDLESVVLYTGNYLSSDIKVSGTDGSLKNGALCLETQHLPNNMNFDDTKTHTLKPGETYHSATSYHFSVK